MQQVVRFGMVAALVVAVAGCGVASRTAPAVKAGSFGVRSESAIGMKQAYDLAVAHTKATYGDDFGAVQAYADHLLDTSGRLQPATWRFNMVGHLRGQSGYSFMKVQIKPDGTPFVDPQRGGPWPDRNNQHLLARLDVANALDPAGAAWQIVLDEGYARKYPPMTAVSWKFLPNDRLKRTVMTFNWNSVKPNDPGRTKWLVDTSIDPITGEVVENGAYKW